MLNLALKSKVLVIVTDEAKFKRKKRFCRLDLSVVDSCLLVWVTRFGTIPSGRLSTVFKLETLQCCKIAVRSVEGQGS